MSSIIIIPARYASSRFPGKPLVNLRGSDGDKTLIQRSFEAAKSVKNADSVYVATDDERIRKAAQSFGADVIMTDASCANGTERCADAISQADLQADIVINLQGDAPLTPPSFVERIIELMKNDKTVSVATPVLAFDQTTYDHFIEDRKADKVGGTTAVFDVNMDALYFSKEVLPYKLPGSFDATLCDVYHHVGLYGYRPQVLKQYSSFAAGRLELNEGLEQLRFLENGIKIRCVEVLAGDRKFWELNNPEDVGRIEAFLQNS